MARVKVPYGLIVTGASNANIMLVSEEVAALIELLRRRRGRYKTTGYTMDQLIEVTGRAKKTLERQLQLMISARFVRLDVETSRFQLTSDGILVDQGVVVY